MPGTILGPAFITVIATKSPPLFLERYRQTNMSFDDNLYRNI